MKVLFYGVRPIEVKYFHKINEKFKYDLILEEELLKDDNIELAKGCDAVVLRANCKADKAYIDLIKTYGVRYLFTRTVAYNHINVEYAKASGLSVARVPSYSPNAIAELAVSFALQLSRTAPMIANMTKKDFRAHSNYFAKEIRNSTVGIIGTGKIGLTAAKVFKGLGARVLGFDLYPNDDARAILEYVSLEELQKQSDIVSLHVPYFAGSNDEMVNAAFLSKMKVGSILVNTSRGEIQNHADILEAVKSGKIQGYATDVFTGESAYFFKNFEEKALPDPVVEELINLYPQVLVTPHIGSFTDEALINMIETSMENLREHETKGFSINTL
ncbi:NAD(P)-dependent oxidoreductase [Lactococcus sp. DD01]|uniref:NAD(P)-dependent oxidoreductase n=1 Tax=Lactococcus sp. DD01 TaxID=1776443 RepID=UPI0007769560|nr:NAD(P)-dependent oxidoreductase [Lactococcus sp. DD01]KXT62111.1 D-lactate dehydrogenase [Lactococcus sp. DD01]